jgi:thioredoxin 1
MKNAKQITGIIAGILTIVMLISCGIASKNNNISQVKPGLGSSGTNASNIVATDTTKAGKIYKVTFVELGSVKCIPCKQMQPIMKSIGEKYGDQVKVVFHDVWTPEGQPFGDKYGIQAIPTQVFLDAAGKEFFRHEGFFPEEDLIKVLIGKGVK